MSFDYDALDATGLAELVATGQASPDELLVAVQLQRFLLGGSHRCGRQSTHLLRAGVVRDDRGCGQRQHEHERSDRAS